MAFFIMILVVLFFKSYLGKHTQNSTYINDIKGEITSQTEQQNTKRFRKNTKK